MKNYLLLIDAGRNRTGILATTNPRADLAALDGKAATHCLIPTPAAEAVARAVCAALHADALGNSACWFAVDFDTLIGTTSQMLKTHGGDEPVRVGGIDRGTRALVAA